MATKIDNKEDPQTIVLKEILKWIKFGTMPQVKAILESTIDTEQKKHVYQLSDGTKNIAEIMKLTGVGSNHSIINNWKVWKKQNLGSGIPMAGGGERFKRDFDLEELGLLAPQIDLEPLKIKHKKESKNQEPSQNSECTNNQT